MGVVREFGRVVGFEGWFLEDVFVEAFYVSVGVMRRRGGVVGF